MFNLLTRLTVIIAVSLFSLSTTVSADVPLGESPVDMPAAPTVEPSSELSAEEPPFPTVAESAKKFYGLPEPYRLKFDNKYSIFQGEFEDATWELADDRIHYHRVARDTGIAGLGLTAVSALTLALGPGNRAAGPNTQEALGIVGVGAGTVGLALGGVSLGSLLLYIPIRNLGYNLRFGRAKRAGLVPSPLLPEPSPE